MSAPNNRTCFDERLLTTYLDERLDEDRETEIQQHLSDCPDCRRLLERIAADRTVWDGLREHLTMTHWPEAAAVGDDRLERLTAYLAPTEDPDMLGRLGQYEVIGLIGQGSTGIVLKALEPRLNRFVAIKVLSPTYSSSAAARRRFEREGRAIAAVSHQHVVPIYAVDEFRDLPYIVMQYIPGLSLQQRIDRDGPLGNREIMRIGLQVARGLAAAHAQGIVHRDVKPANVILENTVERAVVTDFGLARVADEASLTRSGIIAGTPHYMSPEQARGESIDQRSDLFSLGSTMYAACAAHPPFRAETLVGVIHRVCQTEPRALREVNPDVDEWLAAFVHRLIAKQPDARFQSAEQVAEELTRRLAYLQSPIRATPDAAETATPVATARPAARPSRRTQVLIAGLAALAAAVAIFYPRTAPIDTGPAVAARPVPSDETGQAEPTIAQLIAFQQKVTWKNDQGDWNTNAPATFQQKLEQAFPAGPNGHLVLNVDRGDVFVRPSELDDRVTVTVLRRVQAASRAEAEAILRRQTLALEPGENALTLRAELDSDFAARDDGRTFKDSTYRISVPRRFHAALRTDDGNVTVGELVGNVSAVTARGCIEIARVDGGIEAEATDGNIDLQAGCTGAAEAFAVRGNVYAANIDGNGHILASGGGVWLGGSQGRVTAQTSGGDVRVFNPTGPTGVHASGGDVTVQVFEPLPENCRFSATRGDVSVQVADDLPIRLQARGRLSTELATYEVPADQDDASAASWHETVRHDGDTRIRAISSTGTVSLGVLPRAAGGSGPQRSLGGSGRPGNGLGGSGRPGNALGGSGNLGGSGLGGSGGVSGGSARGRLSDAARAKIASRPRPGAIASVPLEADGNLDGYTLYLPVSHGEAEGPHPILVYLQGAYGVGGPIGNITNWGLPRLMRDEHDLSTRRNQLLLDTFIVISPHIQNGQYHHQPERVQQVIERVAATWNGDLDRVYLTGLSRGGHGTWGLAERLPETFAAIAPVGASIDPIKDFGRLTRPAVWIAHNTGDPTTPFTGALSAIRQIEEAADVEFLRVDQADVSGTDYLQRRHILTAPPIDSHDAWTDLYTSEAFYLWLLEQRRNPSE